MGTNGVHPSPSLNGRDSALANTLAYERRMGAGTDEGTGEGAGGAQGPSDSPSRNREMLHSTIPLEPEYQTNGQARVDPPKIIQADQAPRLATLLGAFVPADPAETSPVHDLQMSNHILLPAPHGLDNSSSGVLMKENHVAEVTSSVPTRAPSVPASDGGSEGSCDMDTSDDDVGVPEVRVEDPHINELGTQDPSLVDVSIDKSGTFPRTADGYADSSLASSAISVPDQLSTGSPEEDLKREHGVAQPLGEPSLVQRGHLQPVLDVPGMISDASSTLHANGNNPAFGSGTSRVDDAIVDNEEVDKPGVQNGGVLLENRIDGPSGLGTPAHVDVDRVVSPSVHEPSELGASVEVQGVDEDGPMAPVSAPPERALGPRPTSEDVVPAPALRSGSSQLDAPALADNANVNTTNTASPPPPRSPLPRKRKRSTSPTLPGAPALASSSSSVLPPPLVEALSCFGPSIALYSTVGVSGGAFIGHGALHYDPAGGGGGGGGGGVNGGGGGGNGGRGRGRGCVCVRLCVDERVEALFDEAREQARTGGPGTVVSGTARREPAVGRGGGKAGKTGRGAGRGRGGGGARTRMGVVGGRSESVSTSASASASVVEYTPAPTRRAPVSQGRGAQGKGGAASASAAGGSTTRKRKREHEHDRSPSPPAEASVKSRRAVRDKAKAKVKVKVEVSSPSYSPSPAPARDSNGGTPPAQARRGTRKARLNAVSAIRRAVQEEEKGSESDSESEDKSESESESDSASAIKSAVPIKKGKGKAKANGKAKAVNTSVRTGASRRRDPVAGPSASPAPAPARSQRRKTSQKLCHQCRGSSNRHPKMVCGNTRENGRECLVPYCRKCIEKRYPEITFDLEAPFRCPKCAGTCNCDVCTRGRGERFINAKEFQKMLERNGTAPVGARDSTKAPVEAQMKEEEECEAKTEPMDVDGEEEDELTECPPDGMGAPGEEGEEIQTRAVDGEDGDAAGDDGDGSMQHGSLGRRSAAANGAANSHDGAWIFSISRFS
ncbi:hypothetical protein M0805_005172 [Coniferiporia weirii]|nr:hypothetical protein M0805_005172 [Coniferiporia weirii]